jgi:hypothetical protein
LATHLLCSGLVVYGRATLNRTTVSTISGTKESLKERS